MGIKIENIYRYFYGNFNVYLMGILMRILMGILIGNFDWNFDGNFKGNLNGNFVEMIGILIGI